ncbi:hypothetical protein [Flexibacterium corallicola]|uniref:hypothetical protein n=1 Tax=Flexibacterium corallicola TaxID=3037259 RepID=UPI00286EBC84|nr:hypothetical protein [Pseudovibrio sp. M1P-2-3]
MKFGAAFLGRKLEDGIDTQIAENIDNLLQTVSPEAQVAPELENVIASNLCYGLPMNWALQEASRNNQLREELRKRLHRFETRVVEVSEIDLSEDAQGNCVKFYIAGAREADGTKDAIAVEAKLSRMDQAQLEESE